MTKRDIIALVREAINKEVNQNTTIECKECGHDWDPTPTDTHPSLCHVCGFDTATDEYDIESFMDFWANFNGQK